MQRKSLIVVCGLQASSCLVGKTCQPISEERAHQLESFVQRWYKLGTQRTFTLIDANSVDEFCYRKLVFRASVPGPLLSLYLAPDNKHLVTGLMDLTIDPVVTQRMRQDDLEVQLTSGALLTYGSNVAPLKMVIFSDFQCPYCQQFAAILGQLTTEERSKLQITFRQFPLNIHSWADDAAALGICVALQDKGAFWKFQDFLFSNQGGLSKQTLNARGFEVLSGEKAIDLNQVRTCLTEKSYQDFLQRDRQLAVDLGIRGTPTVFLNGRRISVRSLYELRDAFHVAEADMAAVPVKRPGPPTDGTGQ